MTDIEFPDGTDVRHHETTVEKVQCPNCCKMAPVTSRRMGLLFYECELCGTVGAAPDPQHSA